MKVLLIDVSYNSSHNKVIRFLNLHSDAELICIFDYQYGIYSSVDDAIEELRTFADDYFIYPCAYRDLMTKLLSMLRRSDNHYDIYVCSDKIDDCSIYSSGDDYDNYLYHLSSFSNLHVHNLTDSDYIFSTEPCNSSPRKTFKEKITSALNDFISNVAAMLYPSSEDDIDY